MQQNYIFRCTGFRVVCAGPRNLSRCNAPRAFVATEADTRKDLRYAGSALSPRTSDARGVTNG